MLKGGPFDIETPNFPPLLGVTRENALEKIGGEDNIIPAYLRYGLCPLPLFSESVFHALQIYNATDGLRRMRTPEEYYDLPAVWVDVCQTIDAERTRIATLRKNSNGTQ